MCGFDIVALVRPGLVFNKAASLNLTCNPAVERPEAKSESEFREAKVICIQWPLLV